MDPNNSYIFDQCQKSGFILSKCLIYRHLTYFYKKYVFIKYTRGKL